MSREFVALFADEAGLQINADALFEDFAALQDRQSEDQSCKGALQTSEAAILNDAERRSTLKQRCKIPE